MARTLAHFTVTRAGDDFLLGLEDEDGETIEFTASFDQLDLITEAIDDVLEADEDDLLAADEDEAETAEE